MSGRPDIVHLYDVAPIGRNDKRQERDVVGKRLSSFFFFFVSFREHRLKEGAESRKNRVCVARRR